MTVADRKKQLRIVAEMLLVHLPATLHDQELARDLLTIVSLAIRAAAEDADKSASAWDADKSASAWDQRAYHVKADELRREWEWAPGAANYAAGLTCPGGQCQGANRPQPITPADVQKLCALIDADLEYPKRLLYKEPASFRGARQANRQRERREGRKTPKRSLV